MIRRKKKVIREITDLQKYKMIRYKHTLVDIYKGHWKNGLIKIERERGRTKFRDR